MIAAALNSTKTLRRLWWLNPILAFLLVPGGTLLGAYCLPLAAWDTYDVPRYLAVRHLLVFGIALGCLATGYLLSQHTGTLPQRPKAEIETPLLWAFYIATGLAWMGYAAWLAMGVKNGFSPGMLVTLLTGGATESEDLKRTVFTTIPGVTTCTQFALAAVVLGLWLYGRGVKSVRWPLLSLVILAAMRAVIVSERLALIELLVPIAILIVRSNFLGKSLSALHRVGLMIAPVASVLVVFVLFGTFEYFRSWQFYKDKYDSIAEFTATRLLGYYATAHNNGALYVDQKTRPKLPYYALTFIWEFPLVEKSPFAYEKLTGHGGEDWSNEMLERHANIELNSYGGVFQPQVDFGWVGFCIYWAGFGFVGGRLYRSFLVGAPAGVLMYPLFYIALLESPRMMYLSTVRPFPSAMFLIVFLGYLARQRQAEVVAPPLADSPLPASIVAP